ncbi:hypothetical protein ARMGADRAFT_1066520 [Armillaria gallica]|uniref:Heterokaryon incompatibility domain-containing protein n=1 Tax=Armillaria gallica TaxID=47427 RepID=A0A2H3CYQ2_ARMGA|nr:hypothetical protein ARMGADRAFT_1066520 [Armillaria gallica]
MDIIKAFLIEKTALVATLAKNLCGNIITWIFFGGQARGSKRSIGLEVTNVQSSSDSYSSILHEHTDGPQEPTSQIHNVAEDRNDGALRMHTVLSVPVADLAGTTISLDLLAMPCNFRLVNCAAFIDFNELQIIEFPDISFDAPMTSYNSPPSFAAVSYPWRDLQLPPGTNTPSFSVNGATHADNISIDVLHTACIATRKLSSCVYLWLDRLCMLQTSKADKNWQIQRMYRIYSACNLCLVLPGGSVRLAGLAEPTLWADRAWTLQEASAPGKEKVKCLFKFTHASFQDFLDEECPEGNKYGFDLTNLSEVVETVVEAGHSAACEMSFLCFRFWVGIGRFKVDEPAIWEQRDKFPLRIITVEVAELLQIPLDFGTRQSLSALWALAYTRSSSRPVDMVFSLMDLLGVNLNVEQFLPEERTKATIKLIQEVMELYMAPSREISTLPEMPETSESGRAYFSTTTGKVLAIDAICAEERWRAGCLPNPTPKGEMTDSGYFVFTTKATLVSIVQAQDSDNPGKMAGRFASMTKAYDDRETWAIVIGRLRNWNRNPKTWKVEPMTYGAPKPEGVFELTMMLVEKHKFDLYHRVGMEREIDERITANWDWKYREFKVGGPGRGERVRFGAFPQGPKYL